jgi:hypothetical protein
VLLFCLCGVGCENSSTKESAPVDQAIRTESSKEVPTDALKETPIIKPGKNPGGVSEKPLDSPNNPGRVTIEKGHDAEKKEGT